MSATLVNCDCSVLKEGERWRIILKGDISDFTYNGAEIWEAYPKVRRTE